MDRGAYVVFDYCRSPSEQLAAAQDAVGAEPGELPLAIDVEFTGSVKRQEACKDQLGTEGLRLAVIELAAGMKVWSGKTPVIYSSDIILRDLLDSRFEPYMIWLAATAKRDRPRISPFKAKTLGRYGNTHVARTECHPSGPRVALERNAWRPVFARQGRTPGSGRLIGPSPRR